jgi:hypothetical protein
MQKPYVEIVKVCRAARVTKKETLDGRFDESCIFRRQNLIWRASLFRTNRRRHRVRGLI